MNTLGTLTPAYGRDYKSKREVLTAFNSGDDFVNNTPWGTNYCSVRDTNGESVMIRYQKLTKVIIAKFDPKTQAYK